MKFTLPLIIDNESITLKSILKHWIAKSDEVMICSPFITSTDLLFELMQSRIKFTLICRLSYPATPDLFSKLLDLSTKDKSIYVYDDNSLHSKVYFFKKNGKNLVAIIGSSNFTGSGIYSNKEYNILINKDLDRIESYFKFLTTESYSELNKKTLDYYKTFYMPIEYNRRYKEAIISKQLSDEYSTTLEKFNLVKGLLEKENNSGLPFTYIFDAFCHHFKVKMVKDNKIVNYTKFEKAELRKYFKLFLSKYIHQDELKQRKERYSESEKIRKNIKALSSKETRDFYLGIHSIANGSGSGKRKQSIKSTPKAPLIELLDFLLNSSLSMPQKYSIALTKRLDKGLKVDYVGKSAVGEIPGWLMPEEYPIKNGKLHYIFDFFKI